MTCQYSAIDQSGLPLLSDHSLIMASIIDAADQHTAAILIQSQDPDHHHNGSMPDAAEPRLSPTRKATGRPA